MSDILGKWQQPPGLRFEFRPGGTFQASLEEMGITSGERYTVADGKIEIHQTQHTLGFLGDFEGLYAIEGEDGEERRLTMTLSDAGAPRRAGLEGKNKRPYKKIG